MSYRSRTRVSIHCYQGDAEQVKALLPHHFRHECPVTIISPTDSRVEIPGEDCRFAGLRQSAGQLSLDRQRAQMAALLETKDEFFLLHDADSICLSGPLPEYLFNEPDILWSNLVYNPIPEQQKGYAPGVPRLAFQPPYFMHRRVMEKLVAAGEGVVVNPILPYIDHYMVQLATKARVVWKGFPDGISMAICTHPGFMELAQAQVRHQGRIFIHSVKGPQYWEPLMAAHREWMADTVSPDRLNAGAPLDTTAVIKPLPLMTSQWQGDKLVYSKPGVRA